MTKKIKKILGRTKQQSPSKPWPKEFKIGENKRPLLATMTGEPFQVARIHYDLIDKDKVQSAFAEMKCMEFDPEKNRWVWNYEAEAKSLKFQSSYDDILKKFRPIVIGSFYSPTKQHMYLDVNSFDRVIAAIPFFDKYLSRKIASLSHIQILNKLLEAIPGVVPNHNDFFGISSSEKPDNKSEIEKIATDSKLNEIERIFLLQQNIDNNLKKPIQEIESLPVHFYEDGINELSRALKMRGIIASQHWLGNLDFTYSDIFQKIFPSAHENAKTTEST
jgi:hypothetical protein